MFDPAVWIQAARPLAQINIVVPLVLGQALAFAALGRFAPGSMALAAGFGVLAQLVIVFFNDLADRETDRLNTTYARMSGGSRVLPQGKLTPARLQRAALVAVAALAIFSVVVALTGRPWLPVFAVATVLLVWAYNFAPLRLVYSGHGELVQGLGTGVVLPLVGYSMQAGTLAGFHWPALVPMMLLGYIGNMLSALPDEPSDRVAGKRTYAVRRGPLLARRHALELTATAAAMSGWVISGLPWWGAVIVAVPVIGVASLAVPLLASADAENRGACERFVLITAGAGHLLVLLWAAALVLRRLGA